MRSRVALGAPRSSASAKYWRVCGDTWLSSMGRTRAAIRHLTAGHPTEPRLPSTRDMSLGLRPIGAFPVEPPEHPAIAKRSVSSQSATKRRACQAPARHTGRRAALEAELRDLPLREGIAAARGPRPGLHVCPPPADHGGG